MKLPQVCPRRRPNATKLAKLRADMKPVALALCAFSLALSGAMPIRAQDIEVRPVPASAVEPAAARLFERAAQVYGGARSLSFDYQVRVSTGEKAERGSIKWARPSLYSVDQIQANGGKGHAASDGELMYVTSPKGQQARFALPEGRTYLQVLGTDPPLYYFDEFVRGINPLKTSVHDALVASIKALPAQKIDGATCDGLIIQFKTPNPLYDGMASGSIAMWFDHKSGLVKRQNWSFSLEESPETVSTTTTDYTQVKLNPTLKKSDFIRAGELKAPVTEIPQAPGS